MKGRIKVKIFFKKNLSMKYNPLERLRDLFLIMLVERCSIKKICLIDPHSSCLKLLTIRITEEYIFPSLDADIGTKTLRIFLREIQMCCIREKNINRSTEVFFECNHKVPNGIPLCFPSLIGIVGDIDNFCFGFLDHISHLSDDEIGYSRSIDISWSDDDIVCLQEYLVDFFIVLCCL